MVDPENETFVSLSESPSLRVSDGASLARSRRVTGMLFLVLSIRWTQELVAFLMSPF